MITGIVRFALCIIVSLGLFAGSVLLYAVLQQGWAEDAVSGAALFSETSDTARTAAARHWRASGEAWRLAGFPGHAAEAEARAALAVPVSDSEQRDAVIAALKRALSLRPTLSDLWLALAEMNALAPVNLDGVLAAMRMAQLTAPREVLLAQDRVRFLLRIWTLIRTGPSDLQDTLQDMLVQDFVVSAPTHMSLNARLLRADLTGLPDADRLALRERLVARLGERRILLIMAPPPPPPPEPPAPALQQAPAPPVAPVAPPPPTRRR